MSNQDQDQAQKHFEKGKELAIQGHYYASYQEFKEATTLSPNYVDAYRHFGSALTWAERFPEAVEQFKRAIEIDPINGLQVEELSTALERLNRQKETVGQFQSIIDKHNMDEHEKKIVFNKWGQVLTRVKLYDEAIEQFIRALGLANDPNNTFAYTTLAEMLENIDTPEEALSSIQTAVDKNQDDAAQAYNNWGKTLHKIGRYSQAIKQYEKATGKNNKFAEAHYNRGNALIQLRNYSDATKSFRNALKINDHYVEAYLALGESLIRLKKYNEAVKCYEQAINKNAPSDQYWDPWRQAISKLNNQNNQKTAITQYRKALKKVYNARSEGMLHWGNLLIELGEYDQGLTEHVRAFAEEPSKYFFDDRLKEALANVENPDETLEKFQKIVADQNDAYMYWSWSNFLSSLDHYEMALKPLFYAGSIFQYDIVNLIMDQWEDRTDAIRSLQQWVTELDDANIYVQWGSILYQLEEYEEAICQYQAALDKDYLSFDFGLLTAALKKVENQTTEIDQIQKKVDKLNDANDYYIWGQTLTELGKNDQAIKQYRNAVKIKRDFAEAYNSLGELYAQKRDYLKAIEQYQKATKYNENYYQAYKNWAQASIKIRNLDEARQKYLKAIKSDSGADAISQLREDIEDLGVTDETIGQFEEIVNRKNEADIYNQWGLILADRGQYKKAIEQYKKALQQNPEDDHAHSHWRDALIENEIRKEEIDEYDNSIEEYKANAEAYYDWGRFLADKKYMYKTAGSKYEKALEKDAKYALALLNWGWSLYGLNMIDQACAKAQQVLDDDLDYPAEAHYLWGVALLNKYGQYEEASEQFERAIEKSDDTQKPRLLMGIGWAQFKLGKFDEAISRYQEAIRFDIFTKPQSYWEYGNLLLDLRKYDEATTQFELAIEQKNQEAKSQSKREIERNRHFVYAHHNIAFILFKQGQYERAFEKWSAVSKIYEGLEPMAKRVADPNEYILPDEPRYHADVLNNILDDLERAEKTLENGLEFDPENTNMLAALAKIYREKSEIAEKARLQSAAHWQARACFQKAEKLLKDRLEGMRDYYTLVELGDLYLAMEQYDESQKLFTEALEKDQKAVLPNFKLGQIFLKQKKPKTAIEWLKKASDLDRDDLEVQSNLAEALLKCEDFFEAESAYKKILDKITPYHVESLIGLGEVYVAMADKDDNARYSDAISCFCDALATADKKERRSKKLNKKEKAAVYYSLGYARVKRFEGSRFQRDDHLIKEALDAFEKCRECDRSHQKAKRAIEKIKERIGASSPVRWEEKWGPRIIFVLCLIFLIGIQAAFFLNPVFSTESIVLTEASLEALADDVPEIILSELGELKNQEFDSEEMLLSALQPILLITDTVDLEPLILDNAVTVQDVQIFPKIETGFYVLLTFGLILFIIASLYLPQILRLRVGAIELEKSAVDQVSTSGSFGISRL